MESVENRTHREPAIHFGSWITALTSRGQVNVILCKAIAIWHLPTPCQHSYPHPKMGGFGLVAVYHSSHRVYGYD